MRLPLAFAALLLTALPGIGHAEEAPNTAVAMQAGGLFVHGDIVQASTCILWNRFTPGERVVFRAAPAGVNVIRAWALAEDMNESDAWRKVMKAGMLALGLVEGFAPNPALIPEQGDAP